MMRRIKAQSAGVPSLVDAAAKLEDIIARQGTSLSPPAGIPRGPRTGEIFLKQQPTKFVAAHEPSGPPIPIVGLVEVPECPIDFPLPTPKSPAAVAQEVPESPAVREGEVPAGETPAVPGSPEGRAREEASPLKVPGGPVFEGSRDTDLEHFPIAMKRRESPCVAKVE